MPIYEYQCLDCEALIEKRQSVSDPPLTVCEKCGGDLRKKVSLSGFQFKGEGWYVTDYAGKKAAVNEKTASTPAAESTKTPEPASKPADTAPAAAPKSGSTAKKD